MTAVLIATNCHWPQQAPTTCC